MDRKLRQKSDTTPEAGRVWNQPEVCCEHRNVRSVFAIVETSSHLIHIVDG